MRVYRTYNCGAGGTKVPGHLSRRRLTVQYVHHDGGERRFRDGARVVAAVPLAGVRNVQPTDGSVRQQVRFHAADKKIIEIKA